MGTIKKARKERKVRAVTANDNRLKIAELNKMRPHHEQSKLEAKLFAPKRPVSDEDKVLQREEHNKGLFFSYNEQLVPPYEVMMDTNFINFSIQHKLDPIKGLMDLLYCKVIPVVTDCIVGELEKMGHRFKLALRLAKDPRVKRLTCDHRGTYADDCIVERITTHRSYIVGTSDKDLQRRIRKIPGIPLVYVTQRKYAVERLPVTVQS